MALLMFRTQSRKRIFRSHKGVNDYGKSDPEPEFEVFTVWKAKILQNWKYLLSSTLPDGMYYELTYNGDKKEWYLDAYKKFENKVIPDVEG